MSNNRICVGCTVQLKIKDIHEGYIAVERRDKSIAWLPIAAIIDFPCDYLIGEGNVERANWKALQKIVRRTDLGQIFPSGLVSDIISNYSMLEIIQMCQEYDEEQKTKFNYGDVITFNGVEYVVLQQTERGLRVFNRLTGEPLSISSNFTNIVYHTNQHLTF